MLRHALSISFAALFFCGHLAAQTVRDVLPECLEQDSAGKLQWTKFVATTCPVCEGKKTTPCPICGERTYACDLCTEQRTPCAACDGTGVARDPFRFVLCNSCYGIGQETCPGARTTNA